MELKQFLYIVKGSLVGTHYDLFLGKILSYLEEKIYKSLLMIKYLALK